MLKQLYDNAAFESFGVDLTIKFGGSLLGDVELARTIVKSLETAAASQRIVIFPGGGPTDNLVEEISARAGIPDYIYNPACMRALDQTGVLLSALGDRLVQCTDLASIRQAGDRIPVLLPCELISRLDVFTRRSVITSDTLGAFFTFLLGCERYLILTDVDGIYPGTDQGRPAGTLIDSIAARELADAGATSVDACLAKFIADSGIATWIVNGRHPERAAAVIRGEKTIGTEIHV